MVWGVFQKLWPSKCLFLERQDKMQMPQYEEVLDNTYHIKRYNYIWIMHQFVFMRRTEILQV